MLNAQQEAEDEALFDKDQDTVQSEIRRGTGGNPQFCGGVES